MKFTIDQKDPYTLLRPEEEKIDSLVAPKLKGEFITLNATGTKNIILDLSQVKYVDSSGLSAILTANRICSESGGAFVMCCVGEHVLKLLQISRLDSILDILPTVEEAVDTVFMHEIEADLEAEDTEATED